MSLLSAEVAQRIVERTSSVIDRNVNVMDARGVILASGDPQRLRQQHEGALVAAQRDSTVVIDAAEARLLRGVQPGVNVPLHQDGEVVGVVGISGAPEEVLVLADLIRVTAELILEQASLLESERRALQARDDLLTALTTGGLEERALRSRAAELGVALDVRRRCLLARAVDEEGAEALRSLQWRLGARADVLHARPDPDHVAVWWAADSPRVGDEIRAVVAEHDALVVAEGSAFGGTDGLRLAWHSALDALAVARVGADLYDPRDLPLVALLTTLREDRRAEALAAPWRLLVAADRHGELRATLRAWIDHDLHPGDCADALHIHRNTLRGRLDRIEHVTGLRLRRVPSLLQLYLGPLLAD